MRHPLAFIAPLWLALVALCLAAPAAARTPEQVAEAALRAAPVWDGHNDVPEQLRERRKNMIADFDFRDTRATADPAHKWVAMHTDLTRLRQGKVGAQFWSVYVSAQLDDQQRMDLIFTIGTSAVFPYISEPVVWAAQAGIPTVEINPLQTRLTAHVDYHLPLGAAEAMTAIMAHLKGE